MYIVINNNQKATTYLHRVENDSELTRLYIEIGPEVFDADCEVFKGNKVDVSLQLNVVSPKTTRSLNQPPAPPTPPPARNVIRTGS